MLAHDLLSTLRGRSLKAIKSLLSNHSTTFPLYPIPSHLLQAIYLPVVPVLIHIINTFLHTGVFPSAFKQA